MTLRLENGKVFTYKTGTYLINGTTYSAIYVDETAKFTTVDLLGEVQSDNTWANVRAAVTVSNMVLVNGNITAAVSFNYKYNSDGTKILSAGFKGSDGKVIDIASGSVIRWNGVNYIYSSTTDTAGNLNITFTKVEFSKDLFGASVGKTTSVPVELVTPSGNVSLTYLYQYSSTGVLQQSKFMQNGKDYAVESGSTIVYNGSNYIYRNLSGNVIFEKTDKAEGDVIVPSDLGGIGATAGTIEVTLYTSSSSRTVNYKIKNGVNVFTDAYDLQVNVPTGTLLSFVDPVSGATRYFVYTAFVRGVTEEAFTETCFDIAPNDESGDGLIVLATDRPEYEDSLRTYLLTLKIDPITGTQKFYRTYSRGEITVGDVTDAFFFEDGTNFLFYRDTASECLGASYLKITPNSASGEQLYLYSNTLSFTLREVNDADQNLEYDYTNNSASVSFQTFLTQDDFFVPNASLEELDKSTNSDIYVNGQTQSPEDHYNPNLGAIVDPNFTVKDLVLLTPEDWFSFEIQGQITADNNVSIEFNSSLGDLNLYVYAVDSSYPGGYRLVGRSVSLNDKETVSLYGESSGTFFVRVVGAYGAKNPNYTLTINGSMPVEIDNAVVGIDEITTINSSALVTWELLKDYNGEGVPEGYRYGGEKEYINKTVIQWSTDDTFAIYNEAEAGRYATSWTLTNLDPDTTYYCRVMAYNANNESGEFSHTDWSAVRSFKTSDFFNNANYYALVIGASEYSSGEDAAFAKEDAVGVYNALISSAPQWSSENVSLLTGKVTYSQISTAFDNIASRAKDNDVVFIYYAGLGYTSSVSGLDVSYLRTYKATADMKYLISPDDLSVLVDRLNVGEIQVVLNPYFYNTSQAADAERFHYTDFIDVLDNNTDELVTVITAANTKENTYKDSTGNDYFGEYIVNGMTLRDENGLLVADTNEDGRLSMRELYDYTYSNVVSDTGNIQHPQIGVNGDRDSILIKGDWTEDGYYKDDWWDADGIVVNSKTDSVDRSDGVITLREALDYLGTSDSRDTVLENGTAITHDVNGVPVTEVFEYGVTEINDGDTVTIDGVDYAYKAGIQATDEEGNRNPFEPGTEFTYNGETYTYVDGTEFIDANGEPVDFFNDIVEKNSATVLLEDGTSVTINEGGLKTETKVYDTIYFDPSLAGDSITLAKELTISDETFMNEDGDKVIDSITIDASSLQGTASLDAKGESRHFNIEDTAVDPITITGLKLVNGLEDQGGSIWNEGADLWLVNDLLYGNEARKEGGAIYNVGKITIVNSTISANDGDTASAIYGTAGSTLNLYNSIVYENQSTETVNYSYEYLDLLDAEFSKSVTDGSIVIYELNGVSKYYVFNYNAAYDNTDGDSFTAASTPKDIWKLSARTVSMTLLQAAGNAALTYEYEYDDAGNLITSAFTVNSTGAAYDPANGALLQCTVNGTVRYFRYWNSGTVVFTEVKVPAGLWGRTAQLVPMTLISLNSDPVDLVYSYSYDANGNLTAEFLDANGNKYTPTADSILAWNNNGTVKYFLYNGHTSGTFNADFFEETSLPKDLWGFGSADITVNLTLGDGTSVDYTYSYDRSLYKSAFTNVDGDPAVPSDGSLIRDQESDQYYFCSNANGDPEFTLTHIPSGIWGSALTAPNTVKLTNALTAALVNYTYRNDADGKISLSVFTDTNKVVLDIADGTRFSWKDGTVTRTFVYRKVSGVPTFTEELAGPTDTLSAGDIWGYKPGVPSSLTLDQPAVNYQIVLENGAASDVQYSLVTDKGIASKNGTVYTVIDPGASNLNPNSGYADLLFTDYSTRKFTLREKINENVDPNLYPVNKGNLGKARYQDGSAIMTDLAGNSRSLYGGVDIGAYEWVSKNLIISTEVTTLHENERVGDDKVSLREAINSAGESVPVTTLLSDPLLEGQSFTLNGNTVFVEDGAFVTHNAGDYIFKDGGKVTLGDGDKLSLVNPDNTYGDEYTYGTDEEGNKCFFNSLGEKVENPFTEGDDVRYIQKDSAVELITSYSTYNSKAFNGYKTLDTITYADGTTGQILVEDGVVSIVVNTPLSREIVFNLDKIKANDYADDPTGWAALIASGILPIDLDNTLEIYKSVTIDGSNLTGADKAKFTGIELGGEDTFRVILIDSAETGNVSLANITIKEGSADDENGGAILITNGTVVLDKAALNDNFAGTGGAIYVSAGTSITVTDTAFTANMADNGGAISVLGTADLTNAAFTGNVSDGNGGAIDSAAGSNITIKTSTFTGNSARNGGAVSVNGTGSIANSTFNTNMAVSGGAVSISAGAKADLTSDIFFANVATRDGGAVYNAGTLTAKSISTFDAANKGTVGNRAANGGAIFNTAAGIATVSDSKLFYNTADTNGGAIVNDGAMLVLYTQISGNDAANGAGIFNSAAVNSAVTGYSLSVVSSLITGNTTGSGIEANGAGNILINTSSIVGNAEYGVNAVGTGTVTLENSIIYNSTVNHDVNDTAKFTVKSSVIGQTITGFDPQFTLFTGDDLGTWNTWNLHSDNTTEIRGHGDVDNLSYTDLFGKTVELTRDFTKSRNRKTADAVLGYSTDVGAYENGLQKESPSTIVTTLDDTDDPNDGKISLREAINYATSSMVDDPQYPLVTDIITFDAVELGLFENDLVGVITLDCETYGDLLFNQGAVFTIQGLTKVINEKTVSAITIDGNGHRIFTSMAGSDVTVNDLTLVGGHSEDDTDTVLNGNGGAIAVTGGSLKMNRVILNSNEAEKNGGAIWQGAGSLLLTQCVLHHNQTTLNLSTGEYGGGAIMSAGGFLDVRDCTIVDNTSQNAGGIFATGGVVRMYNTMVLGNECWLSANIDFEVKNVSLNSTFNNVIGSMRDGAMYNGKNGNQVGTISSPILAADHFKDYASEHNGTSTDFSGYKFGTGKTAFSTGSRYTYKYYLADESSAVNAGNSQFAKNFDGSPILADIEGVLYSGSLIDIGAYENPDARDPQSTVVTTLADIYDKTDGLISIGEAIENAKKLGTPITFNVSAEELANAKNTIQLAKEYDLDYAVTIDAANVEGGITLSAAENSGIFNVTGEGKLTLKYITLTNANKVDNGGAIYQNGINTEVSLINCILFANQALTGAAIYTASGKLNLLNTTVAGNATMIDNANNPVYAAVYYNSGALLSVKNSVIAQNYFLSSNNAKNADLYFKSGTYEINASLFGVFSMNNSGTINGKNGNIAGTSESPVDPQFRVNPVFDENGVLTNKTSDDVVKNPIVDLHLKGASQAVNGGQNSFIGQAGYLASIKAKSRSTTYYLTTDYDNKDRIVNGTVDMGAYEFDGVLEKPSIVVTTLSDVIDPEDNVISIREAILYAGSGYLDENGKLVKVGTTITFDIPEEDYIAGKGTIVLADGAILIEKGITIDATSVKGGITFDAGGKSRVFEIASADDDVILIGITITGGDAGSLGGGGIYHSAGNLTLINTLLWGNQAQRGAAIQSENGSLRVVNTTITKNNAKNAAEGASSCGYGGIYSRSSSVALENSLVAWNTKNADFTSNYTFNALKTASLFSPDVFILNASDETGLKNTYFSSFIGIADQSINSGNGINNINGSYSGSTDTPADPYFINWDANNFQLGKGTDGYNSKAINSGDNSLARYPDGSSLTVDLAGAARFKGKVDMGAFESIYGAGEIPSLIVTSLDDADPNDADGVITLREAVEVYANNYGLGNVITFAESLSGKTIELKKQLYINQNIRIDGSFLGNNITISTAKDANSRIMYVNNGNVELVGLTLSNHYTDRKMEEFTIENGGAIYLRAGNLTVYNTLIYDNIADNGGAIYVAADSENVTLNIIGSTITDNKAANGVICNAGNGWINVYNSIIAKNDSTAENANVADIVFNYTDPNYVKERVRVGYSFFQNSPELVSLHGVNGNMIGVIGGTSGIDLSSEANKLFVDWDNDEFQLADNSLAANSGSNRYVVNSSEKDAAGNNRIYGQVVDMGAFENQKSRDNYFYNGMDEVTVTTNLDKIDANDDRVSLREAVAMAERLYDIGLKKTVTFSQYYLGANPTMNLDTQSILITRPLTIDASAVNGYAINGNYNNSIFRIDTGSFTEDEDIVKLYNFELYNGSASNGGAIYHKSGNLWILNTLIHSNRATSQISTNVTYGGGVYSLSGEITMVNCTVANNSAVQGGGIYTEDSSIHLYNSIVAWNTATGSTGKNDGDLWLNGAIDVQYTMIRNSQRLYSLNGVSGNIIGYGDDSTVDPQFVDISANNYRLYPDNGNNPALKAANGTYLVQYGITRDLDGNLFGNTNTQRQARAGLDYIAQAELDGVSDLAGLLAYIDNSIANREDALRIISDSANYNSYAGLMEYYRSGLEDQVLASQTITSLDLYEADCVRTGIDPTLDGFEAYLKQRSLVEHLGLVKDLRANQELVIPNTVILRQVLEGLVEDGEKRWDLYWVVLDTGLTDLDDVVAYMTNVSGNAVAAQYVKNVIEENPDTVTDLDSLKANLTLKASPTADLGAYQTTTEKRSTIVTTELDIVNQYDGLISLREAILYSTDNKIGNGFDSIGGPYTNSAGSSAYYANYVLDNSPITFDASLAGKTIYLSANYGALSLTHNGGTMHNYATRDYLIDATSLAKNGGITIDASNLSGDGAVIFELTGYHNTTNQVYSPYLVIKGVTLTGASNAAIRLDEHSIVEARNCLFYGNGSAVYIDDDQATAFYGIAHIYSCTIVQNNNGIWTQGRANVYNSIVALNGVDLRMSWTVNPAPPAYRAIYIYNTLYTSASFYTGRFNTTASIQYADVTGYDSIFVDAPKRDFRLTDFSLAVNAGNNDYLEVNRIAHAKPEVDINGNLRAYGAATDMGAYERNDIMDAASSVVTTLDDIIDRNDGVVSLREAIMYAEQRQTGSTVVTFDSSLNGGTITLDADLGPIVLTDCVTIDASALAGGLTISGDNKTGIFSIDIDNHKYPIYYHGMNVNASVPSDVNVNLRGLTLTAGYTEKGGAIYIASGNVSVENTNIYGCEATLWGGAIYSYKNELTLKNVNIGGNKAAHYGGVVNEQGSILSIDSYIAENWGTVADYDFYYKAVFNSEDEGSTGNVLGKTRNIALDNGVNNNWISMKDDVKVGDFDDNEVFSGDWVNGVWNGIGEPDGGLTRTWTPPAAAAAPIADQVNTVLFADLSSEENLDEWFEKTI
ncbi:MAG: choice-of-anchor Q domain-containing protein [Planctomycetia bacterium]|nr:choice-of-anchor Q domain-containing protein [Planctomycetia bacterium]